MKQLLTLILFIVGVFAFGQSDETKIYSLIINSYEKSKVIAIMDSSSIGRLGELDFKEAKESLIDLEEDTYNSFTYRNQGSASLRNLIYTSKQMVWISNAEMNLIFREGRGWKEFYDKYGKTQGILTLSRIGFNKEKTQALVYYGNQSDWLAGSGRLLLFEKIEGTWVKSISMNLWVS